MSRNEAVAHLVILEETPKSLKGECQLSKSLNLMPKTNKMTPLFSHYRTQKVTYLLK